MDLPPLSEAEISKLRRMMALFDKQCEYEEQQARMEEEMMNFPTGDTSDY